MFERLAECLMTKNPHPRGTSEWTAYRDGFVGTLAPIMRAAVLTFIATAAITWPAMGVLFAS